MIYAAKGTELGMPGQGGSGAGTGFTRDENPNQQAVLDPVAVHESRQLIRLLDRWQELCQVGPGDYRAAIAGATVGSPE
jgi:hypothetical protein